MSPEPVPLCHRLPGAGVRSVWAGKTPALVGGSQRMVQHSLLWSLLGLAASAQSQLISARLSYYFCSVFREKKEKSLESITG